MKPKENGERKYELNEHTEHCGRKAHVGREEMYWRRYQVF